MNKSSFIQTLGNLNSIKESQIKEIEELTSNFPFCQLGHQIVAKAHHDRETSLSSDKTKIASIYSTDRGLLRKLINSKIAKDTSEVSEAIELKKEPIKLVEAPIKEIEEPVEEVIQEIAQVDEIEISDTKTEAKKPTQSLPEPPITIESFKEENIISPIKEVNVIDTTDESSNVVEEKKTSLTNSEESNAVKAIEFLTNFDRPTNFDYLSELSNINLDNLLPNKEEIEQPTLGLLIPDGLGMQFGVFESYLGETLLSTDKLEENGNSELIFEDKSNQEKKQSTTQIIDSFLTKKPKIKSPKVLKNSIKQVDLSKKSTKESSTNVTETMANIYLVQGNIEKAKNIFEKLILEFPEKKAYFAKKLREIKQ